MKIEGLDFFYLAMPEVTLEDDGSQDVLLVRVSAGGHEGWGECEAAPLVSIAAAFCPRSHGACRPVADAIIGSRLNSRKDIGEINRRARSQSLDLLQADHTLSGIDIALWDLLAKKEGVPVWDLMGASTNLPKLPYASVLFGDTPEDTFDKARSIRQQGFRAAKFGWNGFGTGDLSLDRAQLAAARDGLGEKAELMVDVGTVWVNDLQEAQRRCRLIRKFRLTWIEEPFLSGALEEYSRLAQSFPTLAIAGGEGCHNFFMARQLIDYGAVSYIQIDPGRVGGITTAREIANYARLKDVRFVNHTFTSDLALSAALQPYVDLKESCLVEYPVEPKRVCAELTREKLQPDSHGFLRAPEGKGLGVSLNPEVVRTYLKQLRIEFEGQVIYETPPLSL